MLKMHAHCLLDVFNRQFALWMTDKRQILVSRKFLFLIAQQLLHVPGARIIIAGIAGCTTAKDLAQVQAMFRIQVITIDKSRQISGIHSRIAFKVIIGNVELIGRDHIGIIGNL